MNRPMVPTPRGSVNDFARCTLRVRQCLAMVPWVPKRRRVLYAVPSPLPVRLMILLRVLCVLCASSLCASQAAAQSFPTKPLRVVVGFAPGGANDTLARILSIELNKSLGQSVIVDNRPGAGGTIGADIVAKAPPDGHTLLLGSTGTNGIAPSLYSKLPYDPIRDLAPVSLVARSANLLVVNPSIPAKNVRELVAL